MRVEEVVVLLILKVRKNFIVVLTLLTRFKVRRNVIVVLTLPISLKGLKSKNYNFLLDCFSIYISNIFLYGLLILFFRVFKECPKPNEKQKLQLSKELALSYGQIRFWFQNKRTQMKVLAVFLIFFLYMILLLGLR